MNVMSKQRGAALAVVLMVINIAFIAALVVGFNSVFSLNAASSMISSQQAANLADSAAAETIAALFDDATIGMPGTGSVQNLGLTTGNHQGAEVDFDPAVAAQDQLPYSTNNLNSGQSTTNWNGSPVPPNSVDIWALGLVGHTSRLVEVMFTLPSFPYSIASSGSISSSGGLYVEAVATASDVGANGKIAPDKTLPGSILSNSAASGASNAITLRAPSTISGDVSAVGSVSLGGAVVQGQVISPASSVTIAPLNVNNFDPQSLGINDYNVISSPYSGAPISNYAKCNGSIDVQGKLTLNGGILFVNGDLTLEQGVAGQGALIVNGRTQILSGSNLTASNQAVLLSASDVTLKGHGRDADFFAGFVYTGGNFSAQSITLVGSFVSYNNAQPTSMSLDNVHAVQARDQNSLTVNTTTGFAYTSGFPMWPGNNRYITFHANWGASGPPPAPPADPTAWYNNGACFNGTTFDVQDPVSGAWSNGLDYSGFITQMKIIQTELNGKAPPNNSLWPIDPSGCFPWLGQTLYGGHLPQSQLQASWNHFVAPGSHLNWRMGSICGTVAPAGASVTPVGPPPPPGTQHKVQLTFSIDNFIDISQAARVAFWLPR
jgi:hypothetical protein